MKQSTFSAVMANSIKNLLQGYTKGIRLVAVLTLLLTVGIGQVWGAVVSGTTYSTASSMPAGWTMNGAYNSSSYLKLVSSTNYIQTDEFCVKSFTSIKLKARKFGGPTPAQALITVEWIVDGSSTVLGTIAPTSTTLTDYTISSPASITSNKEGCVKISCKEASSSKGSGVSAVTITYTEGSCSDCTPLEMSEVTATAGDRQIQLSWDAVDNASSYTVTCKNKNTGVSAGTVGGVSGSGTKTCTITGLTNGTTYTWSVMPVGDGSTYCAENDPVEGEATPNVYYTVTWNVNGEVYETTSVAGGNNPTFPDAPSSCDATSTTFYGWATSPWSGKIDDISDKTIYTSANGMPVVNANGTIYYAVFCEGGGGSVLINEEFDNTSTSDQTSAFNSSAFSNFSGATAKAYKSKYGGVKFGTGSDVGYITSKSLDLSSPFTVTLDACKYSTDAGNIQVTVGTQTKTIANSELSEAGIFKTFTLNFDAATSSSTVKIGTSSKRAYIDNVIIATAGEGSNYITTCCTALGAVNNLFINNADNNVTATWAATSSGGESYYLVKLYNSDKTTVIESQTVASSTKTYTFTDPDAGEYWVSVTPLGEGDYCEKGTETFSTNNVTITGNVTVTFDANGGSLTTTTQLIQYNTATNLTTFANLGGSVPTCKKFKNWNTKSDGSGETYTDGQSVTLTGALKLYAIYEDIKYSVTDGTMTGVKSHSYSSNSITCGATLTITCAAADTHKGNPTVTATGTHGNITVVSATKVTIADVQSDITVSISYTPKDRYTIQWIVNGNTTSPYATTEVLEGNTLELPEPPSAPASCSDKVFMGWTEASSVKADGTSITYVDASTQPNGNAIYYAVFANQEGAPSTDYAKITNIDDLTDGNYVIAYGYNTTSPTIILKAAVRDASTLVATSSSPSNDTYSNPAEENIWEIKKNGTTYTLYNAATEKYIEATNTPTLALVEANPTQFQISYSSDHWKIILNNATTYQLVGYTGSSNYFQSKSNASNSYKIQLYKNTSTVRYSDYTTTCTKTYTVSFNLKGHGSPQPESQVVEENTTATEPTPAPTATGYDFGGWYIDEACETAYNFSTLVNSDIILYAKWTAIKYTITYENLNEAENTNPTTYTIETETITLSPLADTDSKHFAGWYENEDFSGDVVTTIPKGSHDNITLYAKWVEIYTVTWYVNGVQLTTPEQLGSASTIVYQGSRIENTPIVDHNDYCGQVFAGWTDAQMDVNNTDKPTNLYHTAAEFPEATGNQTFYAVFADYKQ